MRDFLMDKLGKQFFSIFNQILNNSTLTLDIMKKLTFLLFLCATMGLEAQNSSININAEAYNDSSVISNASSSPTDFNFRYILVRKFDLNSMLKSEVSVIQDMNITLDLFPGKNYTARVEKVKWDINNTLIVRASIVSFPGAFCILTTSADGNSSLKIEIPQVKESYTSVVDSRTGFLYLAQLDMERQLEFECETITPDIGISQAGNDNSHLVTDSNLIAEIDIMVVYTPAAEAYAVSNYGGINNLIATFLDTSQIVLDNSQVEVSLNLIYSQLVNYTETGDSSLDLPRLQNSSDGILDEVHQWRDNHRADLVTLLTTNQDVGGLAYLLNNPEGSPDFGFSLLTLPAIINSSYTPIHEIGHNMGCHHHKLQNSQPGPGLFKYSAGWRWTDANNNRYCSVLTYTSGQYFDDGQRHYRVPHFSNPDIDFEEESTGDDFDGNNARTIRETKHSIAAYRDALGTQKLEREWVSLAPNPTSGILNISTQTPINELSVFDIQGKLLKKSTSSVLDLRDYSSGIYFIQVETNEGSVVKKVIRR